MKRNRARPLETRPAQKRSSAQASVDFEFEPIIDLEVEIYQLPLESFQIHHRTVGTQEPQVRPQEDREFSASYPIRNRQHGREIHLHLDIGVEVRFERDSNRLSESMFLPSLWCVCGDDT
ncbi:MAG: hypothetical protein ACE10G_05880 [Gemmatimonadales bacterium]